MCSEQFSAGIVIVANHYLNMRYCCLGDIHVARQSNQWGYGVVDSISGYEPLDSGSNPDTLAA